MESSRRDVNPLVRKSDGRLPISSKQRRSIILAVDLLAGLPSYCGADSKMRRASEPILRRIKKQPAPRAEAIAWFNVHARHYLPLVTNQASFEAYRAILYYIWYPVAYELLFGSIYLQPLTARGIELLDRLDTQRRTWHRKASEAAATATGESGSVVRTLDEGHRKHPVGKKQVRRNLKYEQIDQALCEIARARPKSHAEVFRFLDERQVPTPNRRVFRKAGGWLKGHMQNRHASSAWLSQTWGRLNLPAFARGPKKMLL